MLTPETLPAIQKALADAGVDGWLLYDFRGINPIAAGLLGFEGMTSRRTFAFIPTQGVPVALSHAIEQAPWRHWPRAGRKEIYSSWRSLEALLATHVAGKRIAMEYSAGDAVPYLDRVPAGVMEMVRAARRDGRVLGRAGDAFLRDMERRRTSRRTTRRRDDRGHRARGARLAGERARGESPLTEHELIAWILQRFRPRGPLHRSRAERLRRRERGEPALRAVGRRAARHPRGRHPAHRSLGARGRDGLPTPTRRGWRRSARRRGGDGDLERRARRARRGDRSRACARGGRRRRCAAPTSTTRRAGDRERAASASTSRTAPATRSIRATSRLGAAPRQPRDARGTPARARRRVLDRARASTSPASSACGAR